MPKKQQPLFPASRIKKIMQADKNVGKLMNYIPNMVSVAIEKFVAQLVTTILEVNSDLSKLMTVHVKKAIQSKEAFGKIYWIIIDFLISKVSSIPDELEQEEPVRKRQKKTKEEVRPEHTKNDVKVPTTNVKATNDVKLSTTIFKATNDVIAQNDVKVPTTNVKATNDVKINPVQFNVPIQKEIKVPISIEVNEPQINPIKGKIDPQNKVDSHISPLPELSTLIPLPVNPNHIQKPHIDQEDDYDI